MKWVRSPLWDGFWLLSGLPIGIALVCLPATATFVFFIAAVFLETGHVLSPIVLTWTDSGLRRVALVRWPEFAVIPLVVMAGAFLAPVQVVFGIYFAWNIYHFGMQNYGVLSLYRKGRNQDQRVRDGLLCLSLTAFGMGALPLLLHDPWSPLLLTGVFSFNHWLTDIGLSSRVSARPLLFIVAIFIIGSIGFLWMIPRADHIATKILPPVLIARWGIGMVHFIYSARIWRLSDLAIRAVVSRALEREELPCVVS